MLSLEMQAAAVVSSDEWIQPYKNRNGERLPKTLYAPEPAHKWCYYYEQADLARQQKQWDEVVSIGDVAYNINDYPNDPAEHFPFIEGYAHTGNWTRAYELTEQSHNITPLMNPLLCRLWQRIDETTPDSQEKESTITLIDPLLDCSA